jgi:DNA polymerase-4
VIACIRIPYFAATLEMRQNLRVGAKPLIVARYNGGRGSVRAMCRRAENLGVEVGLSMSRAWALCPEADVVMMAPSRIRQALDNLLEMLSDYSQWIDVERKGAQTAVLYVDLGKLKPRDGQAIAAQMLRRLCDEHGLAASVGLAAGKFPAYAAAAAAPPGHAQLVPRGEEAAFLAAKPVTLLPLGKETARRFALFGLRYLGQVAALPRSALITQFGKQGGTLHRLASGEDPRRVGRYEPRVVERATLTFDRAVEDRLIVDRVVGRLLGDLAGKLLDRSLTCREMTLILRFDDQTVLEESIRLREPISSAIPLYRACQILLGRMVIRQDIAGVELLLGDLEPLLPRQLSLFDVIEHCDVRAVILDLIPRYGEERFYTAGLNPHAAGLPERRFHLESVEVA